MSESSSESEPQGDQSSDDADQSMMITDDQLPEDLQPDENPLARDPDDESDDSDDSSDPSDKVEGMPDMG